MRKFPQSEPFPRAASIHHDGSSRYVQASDDPKLGEQISLRLRAALDAPLERVFLRFCPDGEQKFIEMQPEDRSPSGACRWWQAKLRLDMPVTSYRFLLLTAHGDWWYNGSGLHSHLLTDSDDFRLLAGYQAPAWVRSSIFYQIFPDRFALGDPANKQRISKITRPGYAVQICGWGEAPQPAGNRDMFVFYGGDLAGIEKRLDYLQELGVNAIYLNPIFTALSDHRYDVIDYKQVDPGLGGNTALASLREAAAAREMRLMLDITPNHCGILHPWFQQALQDPQAPTSEYFTFFEHPHDYACWLGVRELPKLNYRSAALRAEIYASPTAVFRHWLRPPYSIDGWRVDVANMLARQGPDQLGVEIGHGIRQAVKSENPQAYLLGENFFDGSAQLQGDIWDATMNYAGFAKPLWYWLTHFHLRQHGSPSLIEERQPWPTQALVDSWQSFRAAIPWTIARQQYNLLGSHDTSRILTLLGGDRALNRLAVGVLMTYPGVPAVYYGDETGMQGDAMGARQCMNWNEAEWDADLRSFYQTLVKLRRTSPALISGGFQVILIGENTLAYLRDAEDEQIIVVAHRRPGQLPASLLPVALAAIPDGTELVEIISRQRTRVENGYLPLPALEPGIQIWQTAYI